MSRTAGWRRCPNSLTRSRAARPAPPPRRWVRPALEELERRLAPATTLSIAPHSEIEPAPNGTVNLDFTVTRTGDLTSQITVGYTTVAGTARPTTDFTPETGTRRSPRDRPRPRSPSRSSATASTTTPA